ncbi:hypothetical protein [uncultured Endozoicomonas sp.]|uniref:hypothetical protein n=1 Tax=uncultured Endozoicomonas sp. TaxID=432652 RepID=UPI00262925DC|nr:hypothetical protein [uncultured Endozoicomonas sp.]
MKWMTTLMMVAGLGCIIYSGSVYIQSGETVYEFPVQSVGRDQGQMDLSPDMNPIKVILHTRFQSRTKTEAARFYSYTFELKNPLDEAILNSEKALTLRRDKKEIPVNEFAKQRNRVHTMGTISVEEAGVYSWKLLLMNHQSHINHAFLEVRRNVAADFPITLWGGLLLFVLGIGSGFVATHRKLD